ncbi:MAG: hypothetical protein QFX35_06690 [Candidatus Verstraetearchaeota archaeon]|nr:hypothetical protein [Candidatus Verstraetearchaeota archaeon]
MPHRVDELIAFLMAFVLAIVDVRSLDLISQFFSPIVDYLFGKFPTSNLDIEGLAVFQSFISQLLIFTLDLVVYFIIFLIAISAIRAMR